MSSPRQRIPKYREFSTTSGLPCAPKGSLRLKERDIPGCYTSKGRLSRSPQEGANWLHQSNNTAFTPARRAALLEANIAQVRDGLRTPQGGERYAAEVGGQSAVAAYRAAVQGGAARFQRSVSTGITKRSYHTCFRCGFSRIC